MGPHLFIFMGALALGEAATATIHGGLAAPMGVWPAFPLAAPGTIPQPPAGTFEPWMLNLCMGLAILCLIFTVLLLGKQLFGRQPTIHVELEAVSKKHEAQMETVSKKHRELEEKLLTKIEGCLTLKAFDEHRQERTKDIDSLKESIEALRTDLKEHGTANYRGRKSLHKQVNAHEAALSFIAGGMGARGGQVRQIVAKGQSGEEGED